MVGNGRVGGVMENGSHDTFGTCAQQDRRGDLVATEVSAPKYKRLKPKRPNDLRRLSGTFKPVGRKAAGTPSMANRKLIAEMNGDLSSLRMLHNQQIATLRPCLSNSLTPLEALDIFDETDVMATAGAAYRSQ